MAVRYRVYQRMPKRNSGRLRALGTYRTKAEAEKARREGRAAAKARRDIVGTWTITREYH